MPERRGAARPPPRPRRQTTAVGQCACPVRPGKGLPDAWLGDAVVCVRHGTPVHRPQPHHRWHHDAAALSPVRQDLRSAGAITAAGVGRTPPITCGAGARRMAGVRRPRPPLRHRTRPPKGAVRCIGLFDGAPSVGSEERPPWTADCRAELRRFAPVISVDIGTVSHSPGNPDCLQKEEPPNGGLDPAVRAPAGLPTATRDTPWRRQSGTRSPNGTSAPCCGSCRTCAVPECPGRPDSCARSVQS